MRHVPTHQQPSAPRSRETGKRSLADLCRRDPALFARIVRRADWYGAEGWPAERAIEQAMADYRIDGNGSGW